MVSENAVLHDHIVIGMENPGLPIILVDHLLAVVRQQFAQTRVAADGCDGIDRPVFGNHDLHIDIAGNLQLPGDRRVLGRDLYDGCTQGFVLRHLFRRAFRLAPPADSVTLQLRSADGRYAAFASVATNLVPDDTNSTSDIFVRDRKLGTTERVSVSWSGKQANGSSFEPCISADGRFVAFLSYRAHEVLTADGSHGKLVSERRRPGSARSGTPHADSKSARVTLSDTCR